MTARHSSSCCAFISITFFPLLVLVAALLVLVAALLVLIIDVFLFLFFASSIEIIFGVNKGQEFQNLAKKEIKPYNSMFCEYY
jgi:hypothetical protein